jgi:hypothetical protein
MTFFEPVLQPKIRKLSFKFNQLQKYLRLTKIILSQQFTYKK